MNAPAFVQTWRPGRTLAVLTVLAAVLRLPFLFRAPADVDETWSWYFNELAGSGRGLLETFSIGLDGPLYVAIGVGIGQLTDNSLLALRVPSAVFGILAVPLAWRTCERLGERPFAWVAAALTALSPFLIYFSMQARPYAQMLFGCLLFTWAAAEPCESRSARGRVAVAVAAGVAVASHYYAIVFVGTWYALRLGAAMGLRRWRVARSVTAEGLLVLLAVLPLLALLARRLGSLGVGYWQAQGLGLPEILTDEVFLAGTSLGGHPAAWLGLGLVLAPFVLVGARRPRVFLERPWLLLGPGMPVLAAAGGVLLGGQLLFYPRAYIGSTPFLLTAWAWLLPHALPRLRLRRLYAACVAVPLLLSTAFVAPASPRHPFYTGREVLAEIGARVAALRSDYDLVVVHHYFLAQFVAFYHPEPRRVLGLGMFRRNEATRVGEVEATLMDVRALPDSARVLLVENALATQGSDPQGQVRAQLASRRPLQRELPCRDEALPGEAIFCERLLLFGPANP